MQNMAWSIGRLNANTCDILLNGSTISKEHATLNFLNGKFYLIDNKSTNGTFIERDGQKISVLEHTEIFPSDKIYFGSSEYKIDDLIEYSINAKGSITNSLMVINGKSINSNTSDNKEIVTPKTQNEEADTNLQNDNINGIDDSKDIEINNDNTNNNVNQDSTSYILCFSCTTVINKSQPCSECGSKEHINN